MWWLLVGFVLGVAADYLLRERALAWLARLGK